MKVSVYANLMAKASEAMLADGNVNSVKVIFKKRKRKKFLAMVNKDIKNFYRNRNIEATLESLTADNIILDSKTFVVNAAESVERKYNNNPADKATEAAAEKLAIWEIYKELLCQKALKEGFPENVITDEETLQSYRTITQKVHNMLVKIKTRMNAKGCVAKFREIMNKIDSEVDEYKALIAVLK